MSYRERCLTTREIAYNERISYDQEMPTPLQNAIALNDTDAVS